MTERQDRINDWYDNKFLSVYSNLQRVEDGRKLLHRFLPEDYDEQDKIMSVIYEWVLAKNRYRRHCDQEQRTNGQSRTFCAPDPNCYTFFEGMRWKDPIPSISVRCETRTGSEERKCQCGAVGTNYTKDGKSWCARCLTNTFTNVKRVLYDALPDHMKKLKTETKEQWVERHKRHTATIVKEFARKIGG